MQFKKLNKTKMLITGGAITLMLSTGVTLASQVEKEQMAPAEVENVVRVASSHVENDVGTKIKLDADDVYASVEKAEQSELAKFTSIPDWLLIERIEAGQYGDNEEEVIKNLKDAEYDFENIDVSKLMEEKEKKVEVVEKAENAEIKKISVDNSEIKQKDDDKYNNFITKHYRLGNLDDHADEAYRASKIKDDKEVKKIEVVKEETKKEVAKPNSSDKSTVIKAYPHKAFKSYMSWTMLSKSSPQGKLSAKATPNKENAVMMYNGRYLVALGSAYADEVGQEIDIVMESGEIIPAIVGDFKADIHTDQHNSTHTMDGSVVEFIVSSNKEAAEATNYTGSYDNLFTGKVKEFRK